MPACPNLMCSFNMGNTEGTSSLKICVDVCVRFIIIVFFLFVTVTSTV